VNGDPRSEPAPSPWGDSTLVFLREGYDFIGRECARQGGDTAGVRLLLRPTVLMRGQEAASLVYDDRLFARAGAMPRRVRRTLMGEGGVQALDGQAHAHRKRLLVELLDENAARDIAAEFGRRWMDRLPRWGAKGEVVLRSEMGEVLCATASHWCGLPVDGASLTSRTNELQALIDSAGRVGPRHWRGRRARARAEGSLAKIVLRVRGGELPGADGSPLAEVAAHRDLDGALLPPRVAAVELLNLLRPTVAIERYIAFLALALHEHPEWRARAQQNAGEDRQHLVQEVRRFYPLFPAIAAVPRAPLEHRGRLLGAHQRVLLDLYGTNHDPRSHQDPERFDPDRFSRPPGDFSFIPQGGGDAARGHRCPGEAVTLAVDQLW
jgi:fatty-acid peroxygenase